MTATPAQWHTPAWLDGPRAGDRRTVGAGPVTIGLIVLDRSPGRLTAEVTYGLDGREWTQRFVTWRLTEDVLGAELATAGFAPPGRLSDSRSWFAAQLPRRGTPAVR